MSVYIGDVQTFAGVIADKPQVLKIGEETMEVFSAWEDYKYAPEFRKEALIAEIADVIQAACNLLAAIDVDDMRQPMQECYVRNSERGRKYANDTFSAENDATAQDVGANDANETQDSREQLEADMVNWLDDNLRTSPYNAGIAYGWLDRQAAITKNEVMEHYRDELSRRDKREKELRAENDGLKARIESLRSKLSKMLDAASAIQHIGDLP